MRLIDADTLLDGCGFNGKTFRDAIDTYNRAEQKSLLLADWMTYETANLISNFPTYSGWISVEDRLPEINQIVLLYVEGRMVSAALSYENRWYCTGFSTYIHDSYKVTHWMPLPEPPDNSEEGEQSDAQR